LKSTGEVAQSRNEENRPVNDEDDESLIDAQDPNAQENVIPSSGVMQNREPCEENDSRQPESESSSKESESLSQLGAVVVGTEILFSVTGKALLYSMSSMSGFVSAQAMGCFCEVILRVSSAIGSDLMFNSRINSRRSKGNKPSSVSPNVGTSTISHRSHGSSSIGQRVVGAVGSIRSTYVRVSGLSISQSTMMRPSIVSRANDRAQLIASKEQTRRQLSEVFANQEYAEFVGHFLSPLILISANALLSEKDSIDLNSLIVGQIIRLAVGICFELIADSVSSLVEEKYGVDVFSVKIMRHRERSGIFWSKAVVIVLFASAGSVIYNHGIMMSKTIGL